MTKNTLDYLLSIAGQPAPQVQQSNFAETGNVDFAYLREKHYLVDNGRLGGTIMVLGESMQVYRDPVTGKCFYYDDCGISEDFPPELLRLSDVVFTPLAVLLGETYRCDSTPEELVKNALWYIGVPEAGGAEVYLARNIGTNAEVRDKIADFTKEITVLWFGRRPGRRDTDATLCQLSSFLRWDGKAIIHRDAWPQSINDSADRSARGERTP